MIREGLILSFLAFAGISGAGCASGAGAGGARSAAGAGERSPAESVLRQLRKAHGGEESWRRHSGVAFRYRVRTPPGDWIELPGGAFRLGDFRFLWLENESGGPALRISLESPPGDVARAAREAGGGSAWDGATLESVDFGLRSIRYFFLLPLATCHGRWEYRVLLSPLDVDRSPAIEVVAREPSSPHGPCLLEAGAGSGKLLGKLVYAAKHPFARRGPYLVEFEGYQDFAGVRIAARRRHHSVKPEETLPPPFPEGSAPAPEPCLLLEEEVSDIRWLDAEGTAALCPLPEENKESEEEEAAAATGASEPPGAEP
jgi:hypothetical protein